MAYEASIWPPVFQHCMFVFMRALQMLDVAIARRNVYFGRKHGWRFLLTLIKGGGSVGILPSSGLVLFLWSP